MNGFINTIDKLGDEVTASKIIDGTITEFLDNVITKMPSNAFRGRSALKVVNLPLITEIVSYAFQFCSALEVADFSSVEKIGISAFQSCSSLKALIIRTETVCVLLNYGWFSSTPIANGTGYIYVPRALVDSYKTATNWSTYATQFRALEDYTVDGTITGALDESKI